MYHILGSVQHNGELTIPNIRPEHTGLYICTIAMDSGDDLQGAATVHVENADLSNCLVILNDKIVLETAKITLNISLFI